MTQATFIQSKKIERVSRVVSLLALYGTFSMTIGTLFVGGAALMMLKGISLNLDVIEFDGVAAGFNQLSLPQKQLIAGVVTFICLLATVGFYFVFRLFGAFRKAGVFSSEAICQARRLAWLFSFSYLMTLLFDLFVPFPIKSEILQAITTGSYFEDAILLGVIWIGVWVLEYGHDLLTENEMTI